MGKHQRRAGGGAGGPLANGVAVDQRCGSAGVHRDHPPARTLHQRREHQIGPVAAAFDRLDLQAVDGDACILRL